MTLRKACPCCGEKKTTRNSKFKMRQAFMPGFDLLWFDCKKCKSTFTYGHKPQKVQRAA
jgi:transposase-like protein